VAVAFVEGAGGASASWRMIESWTRSRAVTVADVTGSIVGGALEVALCCDVVLVRRDAALELPGVDRAPSRPLVWAFGRAGGAALARGLLDGGRITAEEAVELGLANRLLRHDEELPIPGGVSVAALTSARDLMRCRAAGSAGRALELATFRLLFASGDPEEGARAFFERREPRFGAGRGRGGERSNGDTHGR
jgi:enoyl-CoA hydratase/carnithine racemase